MPTIAFGNVPFRCDFTPADFAEICEHIELSRKTTKTWAKKLGEAIESKDYAAQLSAKTWLLESPEAILTSAIAANRKLKPHKRQSLERCLGMPGQLTFSKPFPEIVRVHAKSKKAAMLGEPAAYRMLHDHGLMHRTAQHIVTALLGKYFFPKKYQFTHLGTQAAIKLAKSLIKEGFVYAARLDIVDFYRNFGADALIAGLPLPKGVVENAVIGRHMKVVMDQGKKGETQTSHLSPHTIKHLLDQARQGIPMGSGSSPIVSMICVSRLAWTSMSNARLLNYADDFQILARDSKALEEAVGKLTEAISNLPGGHFQVVIKATGCAASGIEFLGHRLQVVKGELKTAPTDLNLNILYGKLNALDEKFAKVATGLGKIDKPRATQCVAEQYALTKGWLSAFEECDEGAKRWAELPLLKLFESLSMIGVSFEQIAQATEPWMEYSPSDYALGI